MTEQLTEEEKQRAQIEETKEWLDHLLREARRAEERLKTTLRLRQLKRRLQQKDRGTQPPVSP
jgi:hypothetical protein